MDTPRDLNLEHYLAIAVVGIGVALWLVKAGPVHILAWIIGLGALLLAAQRVGKVLD